MPISRFLYADASPAIILRASDYFSYMENFPRCPLKRQRAYPNELIDAWYFLGMMLPRRLPKRLSPHTTIIIF